MGLSYYMCVFLVPFWSCDLDFNFWQKNLTFVVPFEPKEIDLENYTCGSSRQELWYQIFDLMTLTFTFHLLLKKLKILDITIIFKPCYKRWGWGFKSCYAERSSYFCVACKTIIAAQTDTFVQSLSVCWRLGHRLKIVALGVFYISFEKLYFETYIFTKPNT